ncbi:MAG: Holliday junction branch migration protein RuvA [Coriobacteriales bacterium]|jgi:Holliday junction DNA helicase RuvA|nr:Holliday junction branch migration protein RuvA [Coriobacteriales bacterium]
MIARLRGRLVGWDATSAVIDVGGVGFKVGMSTLSLASLGEVGNEVTVFTTMIVREDAIALYGFGSEPEQQLFEKLITVSGVGPKVALSALGSFAPDNLKALILSEDAARIATIPGIGKKTAQRIILDLRGALDNIDSLGTSSLAATPSAAAQASEALLGMGFTAAEIDLALKGYAGQDTDVGSLIRHALKKLGAV